MKGFLPGMLPRCVAASLVVEDVTSTSSIMGSAPRTLALLRAAPLGPAWPRCGRRPTQQRFFQVRPSLAAARQRAVDELLCICRPQEQSSVARGAAHGAASYRPAHSEYCAALRYQQLVASDKNPTLVLCQKP